MYIYDKQSTLMSPTDLGNLPVTYEETLRQGLKVTVTLKKTRDISINDEQMLHCFNSQLRSNMEKMGMVQILKHHYDMMSRTDIQEHQMEIIPGIVSSIKNCQGDLLMSLDTIHKVLHRRTVLDLINVSAKGTSTDILFSYLTLGNEKKWATSI